MEIDRRTSIEKKGTRNKNSGLACTHIQRLGTRKRSSRSDQSGKYRRKTR
jgi:hypothetical protein